MLKYFPKKILRNYSISATSNGRKTSKQSLISQESYAHFQKSLPNILNKVFEATSASSDIVERINKFAEHNMMGGKKLRGTLVLLAYETLETQENVTEESLYQMRVLAWCAEMVHCYFLVLDDIIDSAATRHGKPAWHLLPEAGTQAVNDASLLRSLLYETLKQNFMNTSSYIDILHLFNKAFITTAVGQHLDCIYMYKRGKNNLEKFTIDRYNSIVDHKGSYYSFKFPIILAMTLTNKVDRDALGHVNNICTDIGRLFQMQDDYLDCYGDVQVTGKQGRDIEEGKCSWLAVTALKRCNPGQRLVLESCYGSKQPAHIERVKWLYDQLGIPHLFKEQERAKYEDIVRKVRTYKVSHELFMKLLDVLYNRNH